MKSKLLRTLCKFKEKYVQIKILHFLQRLCSLGKCSKRFATFLILPLQFFYIALSRYVAEYSASWPHCSHHENVPTAAAAAPVGGGGG
jgi:hypothetical protein